MSLLRHPPTEAELERLYHELALAGARSIGRRRPWAYRPVGLESLLALAGEMLRYDPRLLGILLQLILERWGDLNPLELRRQMTAMRWPQALLVVLSFARIASLDPELRRFIDYVSAGWPRVQPAERFFVDTEKPGTRMAERRFGRNLQQYARWGFLGTERPTADTATRSVLGRYDARTRRDILAALISRRDEVSLGDYLSAVDHSISRQQALADLRRLGLEPVGRGRGTRWHRRSPRNARKRVL
ncbi:MAG: hypothetical protein HYY06_21760 [Deltaproteobacteria bacterium]|nr:hypothetical protein [Deltaproteobacteria bacterium]